MDRQTVSASASATASPDRDWVPKVRPQSTIARNFSAALDDIFNLSGKFDDVEKEVDQKQQELTTKNAELEALEARLRAAEERLKAAGGLPAGAKQTALQEPFEQTERPESSKTTAEPPAAEPPTAESPRPASKGIEA